MLSGKRAIGGGTCDRHDDEHLPLSSHRPMPNGGPRSRVEWRERWQLGRAGLGRLRNRHSLASTQKLRYCVPLEVYISKLAHMRFEPSGMTNDPSVDQKKEIAILSAEVRARPAEDYRNSADAPQSIKAPAEMAPARADRTVQRVQGRLGVRQVRAGGWSRRGGSDAQQSLASPEFSLVERLALISKLGKYPRLQAPVS
jgi:hypothetical protein